MIKKTTSNIGASALMLLTFTLFSLSAIAAGTGAEASEGATETFNKIIRRSTPSDAVTRLVVERNIPITYDYIATLLRIPNAFGEGAACVVCHSSNDPDRAYRGLNLSTCEGIIRGAVVCHSSNDPDRAYRGLNLSTCEGIIRGAMEVPVRGPTVVPGHPENSLIMRFLRNNRMPMGIPFDYPINGKPILQVKKWIDDGAKNDGFFKQEVLSQFKTRKVFGIFAACTDCHMASSEPPSFNGLDLTSYEGVMSGAHSPERLKKGLPPHQIVIPGNAEGSPLYQRLTQNRMPAGINPSETRDHPNLRLLERWITQGARCD